MGFVPSGGESCCLAPLSGEAAYLRVRRTRVGIFHVYRDRGSDNISYFITLRKLTMAGKVLHRRRFSAGLKLHYMNCVIKESNQW